MKESSVNVTLGVGEIVKEVKDTKTIEEVDKTSALVVRAIHAALSPLEKWVLQKEYNLSETKCEMQCRGLESRLRRLYQAHLRW